MQEDMLKNGLKELNLKKSYDPSYDGSNVLNDFYIPCLSRSIIYDRCSAYFSSAVLKSFGKGLVTFFKNGGHARFIFSCQIDPEEMKLITESYKAKMNLIADELDDTLVNDYELANLSYLIQHNYVEVKIAFMLKNKSALMHIKSGIFIDKFGNEVYFDGSGNETESGILLNAETFNVFNNFDGPNYYVDNGKNRFEKIWNNTYVPDTIRTEFPEGKLFQKLISYNEERIFNSATEFYEYKNCVLIDIDKKNGFILLSDYTTNKILKMPMIMKSQFSDKWEEISSNIYKIAKLSVHTIKNIVINRLKLYAINYILSLETVLFLETNDLELEQRVKLGLSIKKNTDKVLWNDNYSKFKYIVDSEMIGRLKDNQMSNAFFHYCMKSSADFSVPGTGKTYISYGLFAYLISKNNKEQQINKLVVFGPINCFRAWKDEAINIFGEKHYFSIFDSTKHHEDFTSILKKEKYDIYLINYEAISERRLNVMVNNLLDSKTLVVFDEIHKLKSITGTRANLFFKLFELCNDKPIYKLALTGTPIPNSFLDIYNYLNILYCDDMEGYLSNISQNRLKQADLNPVIASSISDTLQPFFVRTTKNELNIPAPDPDDIDSLSTIPTDKENELFEFVCKNYQNPLLKFISLIQASSNPSLLQKRLDLDEFNRIFENSEVEFSDAFYDEIQKVTEIQKNLIDDIGVTSKTRLTLDKIKELVSNGEKVIVWCLFIDTIDMVSNYLNKHNILNVVVTGRDTISERDKKIELFKNGNAQVIITNPNTLAESISLHKVCHNAIYLEFGFNLTYMLQSKDRIHRVGLKETDRTHYYYAIYKKINQHGPIDEDIYNRLKIKENRMKNVIESNDLVFIHDDSDMEDILSIINKLE